MSPWAAHIRTGQRQPLRIVVILADDRKDAEVAARAELQLGEWLESCTPMDWEP